MNKAFCSLVITLVQASLLCLGQGPQPTQAPTTAPKPVPDLVLGPFSANPNDQNPNSSKYYIAMTASNKFSFVPPFNWTIANDPNKKTLWLSDDAHTALITVLFRDDSDHPFGERNAADWLRSLGDLYPNSHLDGKPELAALGQKPIAYDFSGITSDAGIMSGRFARIPLKVGFIEISMVATPEAFQQYVATYIQFLLSFHAASSKEVVAVPRFQRE